MHFVTTQLALSAIWLKVVSKVTAGPILQSIETHWNSFQSWELRGVQCTMRYRRFCERTRTSGLPSSIISVTLKVVCARVLLACLQFHGNLKERFSELELQFWFSSKYKTFSQQAKPAHLFPSSAEQSLSPNTHVH